MVWLQNRRHPRDEGRKPWFLVREAIDPAIDPSAPLYPLKGINYKLPANKVKKQKRVRKTEALKQKASSNVAAEVTHEPISIATIVRPSNSPPADISMHDPVIPESSLSSGDSNGSTILSPRISTPIIDLVEASPAPTSAKLPTLNEAQAASILLGMKVGHGDPFNTYAHIGLQLTPYVLPVAERYTQSSVRTWSQPDANVTSQGRILPMGLSH